ANSASDMFSLGLVLYQLLTGRHPFEADSAVAILYAIATRQAIPLSQLNPHVSPTLEALIEAMLQKDARLRPTAAEVEAALTRLPARDTLRAVCSPRLSVRREPELAALHVVFTAAAAGRGSLVCVSGEPGIGKTTLVEDFLHDLTERDLVCAIARGR